MRPKLFWLRRARRDCSPGPRTVWIRLASSFLRSRPTKTSMVLESRSKSWSSEMFDQLGARHHLAAMMRQIGQQAIFLAGELDRIAVQR